MGWKITSRQELKEAIQFLRRREWNCITLTSQLAKLKKLSEWPIRKSPIYLYRRRGHPIPDGVVAILGRGLVIPVWSSNEDKSRHFFSELSYLIKEKKQRISTVMGANPCVTAIEKIVDASTMEPPTDVDYYVMTIDNHVEVGMLTPPDPALKIKKATVDDAQKLFPLQEGYEKEEVLLNPATFKPWNSMMLFKKALQEQIIIYAEIDGEPVAKTGTNALGYDYYQIGGVYTAAPYRNQGIGTFLMKCLTKEITQRDKRLSLFVKKHNSSAIHMYKHIGFTIKEHFRIAYYRS